MVDALEISSESTSSRTLETLEILDLSRLLDSHLATFAVNRVAVGHRKRVLGCKSGARVCDLCGCDTEIFSIREPPCSVYLCSMRVTCVTLLTSPSGALNAFKFPMSNVSPRPLPENAIHLPLDELLDSILCATSERRIAA